jgi:hypothetical protein
VKPETLLLSVLTSPRFIWLEFRDRRAGRQLRLVQDRLAAVKPSDILIVTCLRNEQGRILRATGLRSSVCFGSTTFCAGTGAATGAWWSIPTSS